MDFTRKSLKQYEDELESSESDESGQYTQAEIHDEERLREFLSSVFEPDLDRNIVDDLTKRGLWTGHENTEDLANSYLLAISDYYNLSNSDYDIDKIYLKLKKMKLLENRISNVFQNLTEERLEHVGMLSWLIHCFELWTRVHMTKVPYNKIIKKSLFCNLIDIRPTFYSFIGCIKQMNIFVPKDVLKIIFDIVSDKKSEYWYHGTTLGSCIDILKYGIRENLSSWSYRNTGWLYRNTNTGFYIGNDYNQALNWSKFKSNDICGKAIIAFKINDPFIFDITQLDEMLNRSSRVSKNLRKKEVIIGPYYDSLQICVFEKGMNKLNHLIVGIYIDNV